MSNKLQIRSFHETISSHKIPYFCLAKRNVILTFILLSPKHIAASYTAIGRQKLSVSCRTRRLECVCPIRNRDSRSGIRTSSRVRDTKTVHAACHCIIADTYFAATSFSRYERQCQRQPPDRAEITAKESATSSGSLSSRFFFHLPFSRVISSTGHDKGDSTILLNLNHGD